MIKRELTQEIAFRTGLKVKDVNAVMETFMDTVKEQIIDGNKVSLRGFGTFMIRHRAGKVARDIKKGTPIQIPAKDYPAFKPSEHFFERD